MLNFKNCQNYCLLLKPDELSRWSFFARCLQQVKLGLIYLESPLNIALAGMYVETAIFKSPYRWTLAYFNSFLYFDIKMIVQLKKTIVKVME